MYCDLSVYFININLLLLNSSHGLNLFLNSCLLEHNSKGLIKVWWDRSGSNTKPYGRAGDPGVQVSSRFPIIPNELVST